jgi:hypothetical protein
MSALAQHGCAAVLVADNSLADVELVPGLDIQVTSIVENFQGDIGSYTTIALLKGAKPGAYGAMKYATAPFVVMPKTVTYIAPPPPPPDDTDLQTPVE